MALVTDAPEDLPEANPLVADLIEDPDEVTPERKLRAEIQMSGKTLTVVEEPPGCGDTITLMVELEITAEGREKRKSSDEYAYYRKTRLVACWLPGGTKPERKKSKAEQDAEAEAAAAENQPPLFDEAGDPADELGDDDDGQDEADDDGEHAEVDHDYDPFGVGE
jgi:hypothetical protein